jgi:hypothetical protein
VIEPGIGWMLAKAAVPAANEIRAAESAERMVFVVVFLHGLNEGRSSAGFI